MTTTRNGDGTFIFTDRTGERHGSYVLEYDTGGKDSSGAHIYKAICDCGKEFDVSASRLNRIRSCGCQRKKNSGQNNHRNLTGTIVRDIEAVEKTNEHKNGYVVWRAKCLLCGDEMEFPSYYFVRNHVNCGCRAWRDKYGETVGRKPLPNKQSHVNALYGNYERGAMDRGFSFNLGVEEFRELIEQDCHYCGAHPVDRHIAPSLPGMYACNGIDRVDNARGYEIDNCVPCCTMCNFGKGKHTKEEFLLWVKRVYEHSFHEGVEP